MENADDWTLFSCFIDAIDKYKTAAHRKLLREKTSAEMEYSHTMGMQMKLTAANVALTIPSEDEEVSSIAPRTQ
jgi:hypothetical protein